MQKLFSTMYLWGRPVPMIVALPILVRVCCLLAICGGLTAILNSPSTPTPSTLKNLNLPLWWLKTPSVLDLTQTEP